MYVHFLTFFFGGGGGGVFVSSSVFKWCLSLNMLGLVIRLTPKTAIYLCCITDYSYGGLRESPLSVTPAEGAH